MKVLYIDMENVLADFSYRKSLISKTNEKAFEDRLFDVPGFFAFMKPVNGAVEGFSELSAQYDVHIISTPLGENSTLRLHKHQWVRSHFGEAARKRIIRNSPSALTRGDYLIEHRQNNHYKDFRGERVAFRSNRFRNWAAVLNYLLERGD